MMLAARGVVARYGSHTVLNGVDVTLRSGELVGLIGPNGAGKSTLLRVLAGLRKADGGAIGLDGRATSEIPAQAFARSVAYLAQGGEVHWPMRAASVVALGRLPHRQTRTGTDAIDGAAITRAMQATGVAALADRRIDTLSGGERMRVLLARALAVEADLLLADEPVAALDLRHQLQVMGLLRGIARKGSGVLAVLHDLSLAARFCDRLVLVADGHIVADGSPDEVLTPVHLKRVYGVEMITGAIDGIPYLLPRTEA